MSNLSERQFEGYTLRHRPPEMGRSHHLITAERTDPETGEPAEVGRMAWNVRHVLSIDVSPSHQRQGLATAMWEMGQQARPRAKHSPERTDVGDAWARKVGGRLPRRRV